MSKKLKKCPFCGGCAELVDDGYRWHVVCTVCPTMVSGATKALAEAFWDRRDKKPTKARKPRELEVYPNGIKCGICDKCEHKVSSDRNKYCGECGLKQKWK